MRRSVFEFTAVITEEEFGPELGLELAFTRESSAAVATASCSLEAVCRPH